MHLEHPVRFRVHFRNLNGQVGHVFINFNLRKRLAFHGFPECAVGIFFRGVAGKRILDAVVAGDASARLEIFMGLAENIHEFINTFDFYAETVFKLFDVSGESRLVNVDGLVRAPCRTNHLSAECLVGGLVMLKGIRRIVRGTHGFDVLRLYECLRKSCFKRSDRLVPEFLRRFRGEQSVFDAETAAKVKVNPLIDRIADEFGEDCGEFEPFLFIRCRFSRDEFFGDVPFAEHFPHIVICRRTELPGVCIFLICSDFRNVRMIVRINDGESLYRFKEFRADLISDQISVIQKSHDKNPYFVFHILQLI